MGVERTGRSSLRLEDFILMMVLLNVYEYVCVCGCFYINMYTPGDIYIKIYIFLYLYCKHKRPVF